MEIDDVVELRIICQSQSQTSLNVRHYNVTEKEGDGVSEQNFANAMSNLIDEDFKALLSDEAEYRGVIVQKINGGIRGPYFVSQLGAGPGEGTAGVLPRGTCGLVSFGTIFGGRSGQGRIFLPFPDEESNTDQGYPASGYLTTAADLATDLIAPQNVVDGVNSNLFVPVLLNRPNFTYTPLTTFSVRSLWATRRSRSDRSSGGFYL